MHTSFIARRLRASTSVCVLYCTSLFFIATPTMAQVTGYLDYDPATGTLAFADLLNNPPTTLELTSPLGVYTGARPAALSIFDVYSLHKFFMLSHNGIVVPDFGPLMGAGLDGQTLSEDLCLFGSRLGGGPLDGVELRIGEQTWPIAAGPCPSVPHVPRQTIEPIDFYLDYNADTGNLSIDSTNQPLRSIVMRSANRFIGDGPTDLVDPNAPQFSEFLTWKPSLVSYASALGYETVDLGPAVQPGTTPENLANNLCYRTITSENGPTGDMFVRANGEIFPIRCGSTIDVPTPTIRQLNAVVDATSDVGVVVDPELGTLIVHVPTVEDGAGSPLTRIEISSREPLFIPGSQRDGSLSGPLDRLTPTLLRKIDTRGFGTVDFGRILLPEVTTDDVTRLIEVTGVFESGAVVMDAQVAEIRIVPEPNASSLLCFAIPVLLMLRRRRS